MSVSTMLTVRIQMVASSVSAPLGLLEMDWLAADVSLYETLIRKSCLCCMYSKIYSQLLKCFCFFTLSFCSYSRLPRRMCYPCHMCPY